MQVHYELGLVFTARDKLRWTRDIANIMSRICDTVTGMPSICGL